VGLIPAYYILNLILSYELKKIKLEGSVNNLTNVIYFNRPATLDILNPEFYHPMEKVCI
jgi:Fe(3+) dicitrate transport protein